MIEMCSYLSSFILKKKMYSVPSTVFLNLTLSFLDFIPNNSLKAYTIKILPK